MTMTMTILFLKTAPSGAWKKYMNNNTKSSYRYNNKSTTKKVFGSKQQTSEGKNWLNKWTDIHVDIGYTTTIYTILQHNIKSIEV